MVTTQDAFTDCLQSIHITVDHAQSLGSCVELLTKLPSLKNVHLDFPSFSVAGKVRLCEPSGPHTPWQSLTLSGYVPYKILSKLPLHETTKGGWYRMQFSRGGCVCMCVCVRVCVCVCVCVCSQTVQLVLFTVPTYLCLTCARNHACLVSLQT